MSLSFYPYDWDDYFMAREIPPLDYDDEEVITEETDMKLKDIEIATKLKGLHEDTQRSIRQLSEVGKYTTLRLESKGCVGNGEALKDNQPFTFKIEDLLKLKRIELIEIVKELKEIGVDS